MKTLKTLLATFNTIVYTGLGFQAAHYDYTAVMFLVVPVVAFSVFIAVALNTNKG